MGTAPHSLPEALRDTSSQAQGHPGGGAPQRDAPPPPPQPPRTPQETQACPDPGSHGKGGARRGRAGPPSTRPRRRADPRHAAMSPPTAASQAGPASSAAAAGSPASAAPGDWREADGAVPARLLLWEPDTPQRSAARRPRGRPAPSGSTPPPQKGHGKGSRGADPGPGHLCRRFTGRPQEFPLRAEGVATSFSLPGGSRSVSRKGRPHGCRQLPAVGGGSLRYGAGASLRRCSSSGHKFSTQRRYVETIIWHKVADSGRFVLFSRTSEPKCCRVD